MSVIVESDKKKVGHYGVPPVPILVTKIGSLSRCFFILFSVAFFFSDEEI